jgi:hypothetical protein
MNTTKKTFRSTKTKIVIGAVLLIAAVFGALIYVTNKPTTNSSFVVALKSGADIRVITGEGGMPPDTSPDELLVNEEFTVVFTEPFASLERWQEAKEVKRIATTSGVATIDLSAGKYGVYYIYNGQSVLYSDLTLENPKNDTPRDKQGPWYIKVNPLQKTKLRFSINRQPS